jgi:hypothetical protein
MLSGMDLEKNKQAVPSSNLKATEISKMKNDTDTLTQVKI